MSTIQEFDPKTVVFNEAISARRGEPNPAKVERLANNFLERREAGRPHQIQPGVVRVLDDGKNGKPLVEVIAGRSRLAACLRLNSLHPDEPFLFQAVAVPSNDEQALLDAIDENEFRGAATALDRGEALQKLADLGKSQTQIASHMQLSEALVSDLLRCAKLPKTIQKRYEAGTITEEGLTLLARYNKDKELQEDLLSLADKEREEREALAARAERRSKGEKVAPPKAVPESLAESKSAPTAVRKGKHTAPGRTTADDVKKAVKKRGVQKRKADGPEKMTRAEFVEFLKWMCPEDHDLGSPIGELAAKLEERFDGDISNQQLKNQFVKSCRSKY